jgi:hypothetical protein
MLIEQINKVVAYDDDDDNGVILEKKIICLFKKSLW